MGATKSVERAPRFSMAMVSALDILVSGNRGQETTDEAGGCRPPQVRVGLRLQRMRRWSLWRADGLCVPQGRRDGQGLFDYGTFLAERGYGARGRHSRRLLVGLSGASFLKAAGPRRRAWSKLLIGRRRAKLSECTSWRACWRRWVGQTSEVSPGRGRMMCRVSMSASQGRWCAHRRAASGDRRGGGEGFGSLRSAARWCACAEEAVAILA